MGLFRRNPLKKLKREEVVQSINELEIRRDELFDELEKKSLEIKELIKDGGRYGNVEKRILANKVVVLRRNCSAIERRINFLERRIEVCNEIKNSIDDAHFSIYNKKSKLGKILKNDKVLQNYLETVSISVSLEEEQLAKSMDIISNTKEASVNEEKIYGHSNEVEDVLALMEHESTINDSHDYDQGTSIIRKLKGISDSDV